MDPTPIDANDRQTEVVIYLGTQKAVAVEALLGHGEPRVLRHAVEKNPDGFDKGMVTNLEKAATTLEKLLAKLAPERNEEFTPFVVLGNSKLKTYTFSSSQYYQGFQRVVSSQEIRSVVAQTRSVATLPLSEFVLQAIPDSFIVNDLEGVTNPQGLEAHRLGVRLKIYTMNFQEFKNIGRAFEAAEINIKGFFPKFLTVSEAVSEAGGVLSTGDRSKVVVLRRQADGNLKPIAVNLSAIYKGKAPDVTYLVPGDQVVVPGNKLKSFQKIMTFFPILSFARIFTGGIF